MKTEALWPSHLTSKQHRLSLQNQKSQTKPTTDSGPKRKSEYDGSEDVVLEGDSEPHVKRSRLETKSGPESEGEEEEEEGVRSNLPADFFDDPSQRPPPRSPSPEELGEDPEWDAFEATLAAADPVLDDTKSSLFAKASIFVEPVNYDERGVPEDPMAVVEAVDGVEEVVADEEEEEEEDPIEKQIREEKEEIMERIQKYVNILFLSLCPQSLVSKLSRFGFANFFSCGGVWVIVLWFVFIVKSENNLRRMIEYCV